MLICAAGDIHGAIGRLYEDILSFEMSLGAPFDWVLHVGDFGVWPDPERIDRATRNHDGAGDFSAWLAAKRPVPRRTVFIKGNHEDFAWLESQTDTEVLPGLTYLRNGCTIELGDGRNWLVVCMRRWSNTSRVANSFTRDRLTPHRARKQRLPILTSNGFLRSCNARSGPVDFLFPRRLRLWRCLPT